jgi:glycine/serine hydroxymethyltransferase
MGPSEMRRIAELVVAALDARADEAELGRIRSRVAELTAGFPLYAKRLSAAGA